MKGCIEDLEWDPTEWDPAENMGVPNGSFFQNSVRLGYMVGPQARNNYATNNRHRLGFHGVGCLRVWNRVWDNGESCKVSFFSGFCSIMASLIPRGELAWSYLLSFDCILVE